jgi:DNA-binding NarL/FixJ family response regulator
MPRDRRERSGHPAIIHVVLADDHQLMRLRLRRLLDDEEGIEVIAETDDLPTAVRYVHLNHPQVLVLDLSMSGRGSTIEAIRGLRREVPDTEIVVLKMEASAAFAQHALDSGAIAFVLKDTADTELTEAVRRAARGQRYVSPRVAPALGG